MQADGAHAMTEPSTLGAFDQFLNSENEVLRCAAVTALAAWGEAPVEALRAALLVARMDPDPDVRSDAMEALSQVACAEDADALRHSLMEDPVREVKVAAIDALANIGDTASIPLLRELALSRCEDKVAWEDGGTDWEDWLDVQIAAIAALGRLNAEDAIEDLMTARGDEYGQALDVPVFAAFARMGTVGVAALIAIFELETGLSQSRAADALSAAAPDALAGNIGMMMTAENPILRRLAVGLLPPDDPACARFAREDTDAGVRRFALERCAAHRPAHALAALGDPDEGVRSAALTHLPDTLDDDTAQAVIDNVAAWMQVAGADLAVASATMLPRLAGARSEAPLRALLDDTDRPLQARIAAVRALGAIAPAVETDTLTGLMENPAQQVRAAALTLLRDRANAGDLSSASAIGEAIQGSFVSPEAAVISRDEPDSAPEFATPKEGSGPRRIHITPEGDIIDLNDQDDAPNGHSTLDAILAGSTPDDVVNPPELAEDTPEESGSKRRRRRPVEGTDHVAESLSLEALQIAGHVDADPITEAVLAQLVSEDDIRRRAAWKAIGAHEILNGDSEEVQRALSDSDPIVRHAAFGIALSPGAASETIQAALKDDDALIRATAIPALAAEAALEYLADPALAVRRNAINRILTCDDPSLLSSAVERLLVAERADILGDLLKGSAVARAHALGLLGAGAGSARRAFVLLNGFAGIGAQAA